MKIIKRYSLVEENLEWAKFLSVGTSSLDITEEEINRLLNIEL